MGRHKAIGKTPKSSTLQVTVTPEDRSRIALAAATDPDRKPDSEGNISSEVSPWLRGLAQQRLDELRIPPAPLAEHIEELAGFLARLPSAPSGHDVRALIEEIMATASTAEAFGASGDAVSAQLEQLIAAQRPQPQPAPPPTTYPAPTYDDLVFAEAMAPRLKQLRGAKGVKQFARELGVDANAWRLAEAVKIRLPDPIAQTLVDKLAVDEDWLLSLERDPV